MPDIRFQDLVEEVGYVNNRGQHVYGSAAWLHYSYLPISDLPYDLIVLGKKRIDDLLNE